MGNCPEVRSNAVCQLFGLAGESLPVPFSGSLFEIFHIGGSRCRLTPLHWVPMDPQAPLGPLPRVEGAPVPQEARA